MRRVFIFVFAGMTLSVCAQALREDSLLEKDGSDGLPEWNDQELEALEAGDYVPGSSLMGKLAREKQPTHDIQKTNHKEDSKCVRKTR